MWHLNLRSALITIGCSAGVFLIGGAVLPLTGAGSASSSPRASNSSVAGSSAATYATDPGSGLPVPSLRVPATEWAACSATTTTAVTAPDGRVVARLASPPQSLSSTITAEFPPCSSDVNTSGVSPPSGAADLSFTVLSQVEYQGSGGAITLVTASPSSAALSHALYLGNADGTLSDGTPLWTSSGAQSGNPTTNLSWFIHGVIVSMSGNLPLAQLESLAQSVTTG